MGHHEGMLGRDVESDAAGRPIELEGRRTYAHVEILDHDQTLAQCAGWLGLGRDTSLCFGGVREG